MHAHGRGLLAALVCVLGIAAPQGAHAQSLPSLFYGRGMPAGDVIRASIGGRTCAEVTVNGGGEWVISIPAGAACGPTPGAAVDFAVNGRPAGVSPGAVWQNGGVPGGSALVDGYRLTPGAAAAPAAASPAAASPTAGANASTPGNAAATGTAAPGGSGAAPTRDAGNASSGAAFVGVAFVGVMLLISAVAGAWWWRSSRGGAR